MKKVIVVTLLVLFMAVPVFARSSGQSKSANVYQRTYFVSDTITVTLPYGSTDVTIINGDASQSIWVDLDGGTLPGTFGSEGAFVLPKASETKLINFMAESITLYPYSQVASPVSVIVTY